MRRSVVRSVVRRLAAGVAIGVTLLGTSAAGMLAASAAVTATPDAGYAVSINQGNVPTTAAAGHSCDEFATKAATDDGWLFVTAPDSNDFTSFKAIFDQGTVYFHDPNGAADSTNVSFPKPNSHLAVVTPAGWTLKQAFANLSPGGDKAFFNLSHTCAATEQPSPKPTVSFNNDCETGAILISLGNVQGTAPTTFTLTYGGADHTVDVPAGGTSNQSIPVAEDTTGSVTVAATGVAGTPITHTWARNCSTDTDQTPAAAPTAAISHSCEIGGFHGHPGNTAGTAPADFTVHYNGADHAVTVAAGTTTEFTVPVDEDTRSRVPVAATGLPTQSDPFARDCTHTVPPQSHGINPAVAFSTSCFTGITTELSNMKLDDTTTDAVTFTVTTPTGAQEQVLVIANQSTKRSYDVAEGTTVLVTVEAPGLAMHPKPYAKSWPSVLGEQETKGTKGTKTPSTPTTTPTPAVEGEKVVQLPVTGAPSGAMVEGALLLLLAGVALSFTGRRRYAPRHAAH